MITTEQPNTPTEAPFAIMFSTTTGNGAGIQHYNVRVTCVNKRNFKTYVFFGFLTPNRQIRAAPVWDLPNASGVLSDREPPLSFYQEAIKAALPVNPELMEFVSVEYLTYGFKEFGRFFYRPLPDVPISTPVHSMMTGLAVKVNTDRSIDAGVTSTFYEIQELPEIPAKSNNVYGRAKPTGTGHHYHDYLREVTDVYGALLKQLVLVHIEDIRTANMGSVEFLVDNDVLELLFKIDDERDVKLGVCV